MMSELIDRLRRLGLRATAAQLSDLVARATKDRWSAAQVLEHAADLEEQDRSRRSLERRLARSRIGRFKPMADFDWSWPKHIDRDRVEAALHLGFLQEARNIVLVAPQGLGKTMIAQNIAHEAILAGHSVLVLTAAQLLLELGAQDSARSLDRRLRHYAKQSLLVIDEVGYLAFDNRNADLLFQVVARRYERKSIVLTTNLAFRDWPTIFPNATCATALIDRIIHHADVIDIDGESYRLRQAEERSRAPAPKSAMPKKKG
jgi:DNA replication protein DnaC